MKSQELTSTPEITAGNTPHGPASNSVEVGLSAARTVYWWILAAVFSAWGLSGMTTVAPGEVALIRRCGQWLRVNGDVVIHRPGLLFALPMPFDQVEKIAVTQERVIEISLLPTESENSSENSEVRNQYLLTGDRSVLGLSLQARYRISDPADWLISASNADLLLRKILIASTSAVIGQWPSDDVLRRQRQSSEGKSITLQTAVLESARRQMESLNPGIELTAIEFTAILPPENVRDAFVAVQDARVDQESLRAAANGEDSEIRLNAERMALVAIADARGKLDSILGRTALELELFKADLDAFEADASGQTANRLQREAWEAILRQTGRVISVPSGDFAQGLWLSVPDAEKSP